MISNSIDNGNQPPAKLGKVPYFSFQTWRQSTVPYFTCTKTHLPFLSGQSVPCSPSRYYVLLPILQLLPRILLILSAILLLGWLADSVRSSPKKRPSFFVFWPNCPFLFWLVACLWGGLHTYSGLSIDGMGRRGLAFLNNLEAIPRLKGNKNSAGTV
jgi:hypothetical protein